MSKFHIWVSIGNQYRDSVTLPSRRDDVNEKSAKLCELDCSDECPVGTQCDASYIY